MKKKSIFLMAVIFLMFVGFYSCEMEDNTPNNRTEATDTRRDNNYGRNPSDTINSNPENTPTNSHGDSIEGNPNNPPAENPEDSIGRDWVDLGLPSGLLWATHNVGATNPEDYGDYFAWGEIIAKSVYNWGNYAYCTYCNVSYYGYNLTKYCNNSYFGYNGFVDNLISLQANDDAATANWGYGARTPTKAEWNELISNCTGAWITQNEVKGYRFTGHNNNTLFLPAVGNRLGNEFRCVGYYGFYWASSIYTDQPHYAWFFSFGSDSALMADYTRCHGFSVRPVRSAR